jgi:glycerol-3-phosphate dehydrogenase (NAD(P)+)
VGGGSWGTAFARVLQNREHDVTLACRDPEQAHVIAETGRNPRYLTHCNLRGVKATTIETAPLDGADVIVLAVPSAVYGAVAGSLGGDAPMLTLTKGVDPATGERLSTLVKGRPVAVLTGPNIADEISRDLPAAAVIASEDAQLALELQAAITSITFRVYVSDDVVGVVLCAAG